MKELEKIYDPSSVEDKHYKKWVDAGYFHAERDPDKRPYTIVMPPPNITGQLHMGHAMDETWQDILIRYKRMQGYAALWVPGTDHASIATEAKIVAKPCKEEGLTKQDLGRERFLERAWDWKKQYGGRIVEQLKKLGCSCDWERERFTMDEGCSKAVREGFLQACTTRASSTRGSASSTGAPTAKPSISDAEVEYEEQDGFFWHICNTRWRTAVNSWSLPPPAPRPCWAIPAIAVHPDDERYTPSASAKQVILPLVGKEIPVVGDDVCGPGIRHGRGEDHPRPRPQRLRGGRAPRPARRQRADGRRAHERRTAANMRAWTVTRRARPLWQTWKPADIWLHIEPHKHNVGTCYRCGTTVEPMVSKQWFVKMVPLAGPAIEAVRDGQYPSSCPSVSTRPITTGWRTSRDWCISPPALVGPPHPSLLLRRLRRDQRFGQRPLTVCPKCGKHRRARTRTRWTPGFPVRPVAVLHAGMAGRDRGP